MINFFYGLGSHLGLTIAWSRSGGQEASWHISWQLTLCIAEPKLNEVHKSHATSINLIRVLHDASKRGAAKHGFYMTTHRLLTSYKSLSWCLGPGWNILNCQVSVISGELAPGRFCTLFGHFRIQHFRQTNARVGKWLAIVNVPNWCCLTVLCSSIHLRQSGMLPCIVFL